MQSASQRKASAMSTYASEGHHWYRPDGTPCYEVPAKKGGMRATTITDARKFGLVPSVTTIIRCASAPSLEAWKIEQNVLAALTLPRLEGELDADFVKRVKEDGRETARKAAERGTDIHGAIERVLLGEDGGEWTDHANAGLRAAAAIAGEQAWSSEKSFAHPEGFGGKVDLHSPEWVIDFKTKEFSDVSKVALYDEHFMQIAAYRYGLGIHDAAGGIVFVSATVPGLATLLPVAEKDLERGWKMFLCLLGYWQAKNGWPWNGKE
jgi:hypothetical protein